MQVLSKIWKEEYRILPMLFNLALKGGFSLIEPYNLNGNSENLDAIMNNFLEKGFFFIVIVLAILITASLIIWFVGAKIKSEKITKMGLRNFIITLIIEVCILAIPFIITFFI